MGAELRVKHVLLVSSQWLHQPSPLLLCLEPLRVTNVRMEPMLLALAAAHAASAWLANIPQL